MPGVVVHFLVAQGTLSRWRSTPGGPPFDPDDPVVLNAFLHGAVGPDLGYFPGGARVLSDLAHGHRTGVLARTLAAEARNDRERAFAWGWVTHLLADLAIHPWIGRGVGEFTTGRSTFVDGASDPCAHLQVEMGVDAWFGARHPHARSMRLRPVFDSCGARLLVEAYERVYAARVPAELFLRSHKAVCVRAGQLLSTLGIVHSLRSGGPVERCVPSLRRAVERGLRTQRLRRVSLAYLAPAAPRRWLIAAIRREVMRQPDQFLAHFRSDLTLLDDHNLDTGRPIRLQPTHPATLRALRGLRDLAGRDVVDDPVQSHPAWPRVAPTSLDERPA